MKKYLKLIFFVIMSCVIFILIWATTITIVKNIEKIALVEQFKSRGVLVEDKSDSNTKFYKIASNEKRPTYTPVGSAIYPGTKGDILVTTQAVVGTGLPFIGDFLNGFVGFYAGGHAALSTMDYRDSDISLTPKTSIEATGMRSGDNPATIFDRGYAWAYQAPYTEVIGLRVKMNEEEIDEVVSKTSSLIDDPYNFSFIFNTRNTSYCTDIISKGFSNKAHLNKDGFATTIYDLICTSDTYISYYHYYDSNGVKHIYYLDWSE